MLLSLDNEKLNLSLSSLRSEVRKGNTLEEAAQRMMDRFCSDFSESVVMARTYATVPYYRLPRRDREYIAARQFPGIKNDTHILSLMGTSGVEPAWCNRSLSRDHLCIPLVSEEAVSEMPMVAALIRQLGTSVSWYESVGSSPANEGFGVFTESFFVKDPSQARDSVGRLLIPAQDFVKSYNINSVFGVGGSFLGSGINLVCIFFSKERASETPSWLLRIPLMLATVTRSLVSGNNLFTE